MIGSEELGARITARIQTGEIEVPPYPAAAAKITSLLGQEDFSLLEVSNVIATDQSLSMAVLRCANSSAFSTGEEVTALRTAVVRLGAKNIVAVVLAAGLEGHICKPGAFNDLRQEMWRQGLASAMICQALAQTASRNLLSSEAFLCGLLHDIGRSVALSCLEDILDDVEDVAPMPFDYWDIFLDRYHLKVGKIVAERWELPEVLTCAITEHEGEATNPDLADTLQAVKISDRVCAYVETVSSLDDTQPSDAGIQDQAEWARVRSALATIPSLLTALAGDKRSVRHVVSQLAVPSDKPGAVPEDKLFVVQRVTPKGTDLYRAVQIEGDQMLLVGHRAIPAKTLIKLTFDVEESLSAWFVARGCFDADGDFQIQVSPYLLAPDDYAVWRTIATRSYQAAS